jgi:probable F420-dependent oxidoreductase
MARQVEAAGLDSIWFFDHLFIRRPDQPVEGNWDSWTLMSALAEATERVEIGSLVLGPFRNPALLAKMAATLDEVSGGRLILGLGAGWHEPEYHAMGLSFQRKAERFDEALQIIVPLLREGRVTFEGRHYQAVDAELIPRGPRSGGPPILIAAFGDRMLRLAARYADLWNTAWYGDAAKLAEPLRAMQEACDAVGRDRSTLATTVGVMVAPGESASQSASALSGSPGEIAAGLRSFAEAGVEHVICRIDDLTQEALAQLAEAAQGLRGETRG